MSGCVGSWRRQGADRPEKALGPSFELGVGDWVAIREGGAKKKPQCSEFLTLS